MDHDRWVNKAQTEYRGKRSEARAKLAFFDVGSLEVELIDKNGEDPHYIAFEILENDK